MTGGAAAAADVRVAAFGDLPARTAYQLWRLRLDVFVVEQRCAYAELDGRDLEPGTRHLWVERGDRPVGYLRLLAEPDGSRRIGRVCVAVSDRGRGLADLLVGRALVLVGERRCVLDAQAHLASWYARRGFVPTGPPFEEDGIAHVPMGRPPARDDAATSR
ncbi:MAG: GNAT family N-acetyltransferase [Actinomycetota bacterium]|nr:GNAT family N-acetyltransferase [Actinomycetota bacterium]